MYSRQHNDTNEPTQAPEDEECDVGCEICQNGGFPIANGDSSGVPPDREDACRYSIDDKGGAANNSIVIEDEDDGVGISPIHSPGNQMERKRKRSLDSEGDDMLPKSKVRHWE